MKGLTEFRISYYTTQVKLGLGILAGTEKNRTDLKCTVRFRITKNIQLDLLYIIFSFGFGSGIIQRPNK